MFHVTFLMEISNIKIKSLIKNEARSSLESQLLYIYVHILSCFSPANESILP